LLLCDEPTGALDTETGKAVLKVLSDFSKKMGKTVMIITHNSLFAPMANRLIEMKNGWVVREAVTESQPIWRVSYGEATIEDISGHA
jgi:putative ABC transport system ATP-binding protein